jgi:hypothetical protein
MCFPPFSEHRIDLNSPRRLAREQIEFGDPVSRSKGTSSAGWSQAEAQGFSPRVQSLRHFLKTTEPASSLIIQLDYDGGNFIMKGENFDNTVIRLDRR